MAKSCSTATFCSCNSCEMGLLTLLLSLLLFSYKLPWLLPVPTGTNRDLLFVMLAVGFVIVLVLVLLLLCVSVLLCHEKKDGRSWHSTLSGAKLGSR